MTALEQKLLDMLKAAPGEPFTPDRLIIAVRRGPRHERDRAVRNALQRLTARGDILRPARGVYQSK